MVLVGTAVAVMVPSAVAGLSNPGAHGFTQVLYAFSSAANNNGSAFAGLNANTDFYNPPPAWPCCSGRFGMILPVLAIAGSLGGKKRTPPGAGHPAHPRRPVRACCSSAVAVIVGALTFLPALALGPIVEHLAVLT